MGQDSKDSLFPHERVREEQDLLMSDVSQAIASGRSIICHAPTGLGKTAAVLGPALAYAIKNGLTVFFLTPRHTQHRIVLETTRLINERYRLSIKSVDIIGKRWMCPAVAGFTSSAAFADFCRSQREEGKCEYYSKTLSKGKLSLEARLVLKQLKNLGNVHAEQVAELCSNSDICSYEILLRLAKSATLVVADYYHIFNPSVSASFLSKTDKDISQSIIIVDEAHNLPGRVRELLTERLSTFMIGRAVKEAKRAGYRETLKLVKSIGNALLSLLPENVPECIINRDEFISRLSGLNDYKDIISNLRDIAEEVIKSQKESSIGAIARFLEVWAGPDEGFVRIISRGRSRFGEFTALSYNCLDPALATQGVLREAHSAVMMSGTLLPTELYRDILGFGEGVDEKVYKSPFPKKNRLALVLPLATTRYKARNPREFERIALICASIVNFVPGNSAVFFPSYYLRDQVNRFFSPNSEKTVFLEQPGMDKAERADMLSRFAGYAKQGAVLLGVVSGSFGEGVDFANNLLKCVVIVGLPLQQPDLQTKALIDYYDKKFSKGWDYGYVFPAFNKALQSAGRCIRSETDRGVLVFLDERYAWPNYKRCFPPDWNIKITRDYQGEVKGFFNT